MALIPWPLVTDTTSVLRIFAAAICVAAALVAVKNERLIQRAGLSGSCWAVSTPPGQSGEWRACQPGRLAGRPDLSRRSCTKQGLSGRLEYWRCPAPVESSPIGQ
jgi:hypothetical protein